MTVDTQPSRETARVDFLVDETGARIGLPEDTPVTSTSSPEQAIGGTGPSLGWRLGLLALVVVVGLLLVAQFFSGGAGTDVIPGTPTVAPAAGTPPAAAAQGG